MILQMFYKDKELVVSATRHPKHISQVAENITVVTAKDIEEMNAHSVAEVLNRVPGLFISFNRDFGATSFIHTQGSWKKHILVLVDGVSWNLLSSGAAEINSIPVGIIDRIEVVKGPASSAWGSALGGVVNIITKPVGTTERPSGSAKASYGERDTQDYNGQVFGLAGPVGYYLSGGIQESDGLRDSRDFDTYNLYLKLEVPVSEGAKIGISSGYTEPHVKVGVFSSYGFTDTVDTNVFFTKTYFDASPTEDLGFEVSFHYLKQEITVTDSVLEEGLYGNPGELYFKGIYDNESLGAGGKLVWEHGLHTVVMGADFDHGDLDQTLHAGRFLRRLGLEETSETDPHIDRWALYVNDTIVVDRLSVTPGLRYDFDSITGSFVSPSLGITYRLGEGYIFRGCLARGFTTPPLSWTSGGAFFLIPNPSLDPEEVWSYQFGVESTAVSHLWVRATFFRHELEDALTREIFAGGSDMFVNGGKVTRDGFELEAETLPVYNFSLRAGFAYVDLDPSNENGSGSIYSYNIRVRYDDGKSFFAQLFGHYVWWDLDSSKGAEYDDFVWDLNLKKKIYSQEKTAFELFFTAHNIFNGSQYSSIDSENPRRWLEAGVKLSF